MELSFGFELKSVEDSGSFTGLAAVYGNVDHGGDLVLPGAFTQTLSRSKERPLLWAHDTSEPIGLGTLEDSPTGLAIDGQLDLDVQAGRDAYSRVRKKIVKGLSIGYRSIRDEVKNGVRHLAAIELYEVSLVVLPMNPAATVRSVKSQITCRRDFEHFLREHGWSKSQAKRLSRGWDDGQDDEDDDDEILLTWLKEQRAAKTSTGYPR